jgi:N6-L-threonylcarbamoyladenine synthase
MILAIDTSCDETAAAVTDGAKVLSNIIWSQASQHAQFGGVMPSLAQRMHRERIDWVINRALKTARTTPEALDAVAVTTGPGLAIALEVGIQKAKDIAAKYDLPLLPINHVEGHLLSSLANKQFDLILPCLGVVVSGGHTEIVLIKSLGRYQILAKTQDDALGEALDKAARMLGLGYPGGAVLEKMAREGNPKAFPLPLPMARREEQASFSYSGLKTAMWRLTEKVKGNRRELSKQEICDLAASFQYRAFQHLDRITDHILKQRGLTVQQMVVGGGVAANMELRKRLRKLGKEHNLKVTFPYSSKLVGDNAAMIGLAAGYKPIRDLRYMNTNEIDRKPRWSVEEI